MKFLHLSDLHIGKNVNGFSMLEEQKHVFKQIIEYIKSELIDAVVIAGDVYDRAVPGIEAVRVFDDFLTELAGLNIFIMIISGNHDSPERINFASRLLSTQKIFIRGTFDKIILNDNYGEINFYLLPFVKPEFVSETIENFNIDYNSRNILVSHQFFTKSGVVPERSESEINPIGGLDAIDCGCVEKFDYVALGHLHGAQKIGAEYIRYAGSPVKYSFSERKQEKSVTLVELNEKNNINIKKLILTPVHDMREIKGELEKLLSDEVLNLADKEDYLRVILTDEEEIIDPMGKIRGVYPNVMTLDFENSRANINISDINPDSEKIENLSPYDLFSEFFLDINGAVMSEEQAKIVRELLESGANKENEAS